MAEKIEPQKTKKEHLAVTLSKKFEKNRKEIGKLERADAEKHKEKIEELHREALELLQQMKELDEKFVASIDRKYAKIKKEFEEELEPVIKEADNIKAQLEALDKEDADLDQLEASLNAHIVEQ
ncbi:MAG: hypothetical protein ACK4FA_01310, partial [Candidatus Paceibacteria bacterium]